MTFIMPEEYRDRALSERIYGWAGDETCGVFVCQVRLIHTMRMIGSSAAGWEHVSVSLTSRRSKRKQLPTWGDMCRVKRLFWGPEDCVVQFHPPESQYVDVAEVLHLWRPRFESFPTPPSMLVGPRDVSGGKGG